MRKEVTLRAPRDQRDKTRFLLWLYLIPGGLLALTLGGMIAQGQWLSVLIVLGIGASPLPLAILCATLEAKLRSRKDRRRGGPGPRDD